MAFVVKSSEITNLRNFFTEILLVRDFSVWMRHEVVDDKNRDKHRPERRAS